MNSMGKNEAMSRALSRNRSDILGEEALSLVNIIECNEPLVDIQKIVDVDIEMSEVRRGYEKENKAYARQSICNMLKEVDSKLPEGYKIVIFDAHRPVEYQEMRFNWYMDKIRNENPGISNSDARKKTFEFIFPPSYDLKTPPPHSTGGAIDLSIKKDGKLLDMGCRCGQFDETTFTNTDKINPDQKSSRIFLLERMIDAGFTNYPGEWWHFMYGDREWAAYEGKTNAIYTRIERKV